jgi:hypothetical protein
VGGRPAVSAPGPLDQPNRVQVVRDSNDVTQPSVLNRTLADREGARGHVADFGIVNFNWR